MVVGAKLRSAQAMPETKLGFGVLIPNIFNFKKKKKKKKKKKSIVSEKHKPGDQHLNLSKSAEEKTRTGDVRKWWRTFKRSNLPQNLGQ